MKQEIKLRWSLAAYQYFDLSNTTFLDPKEEHLNTKEKSWTVSIHLFTEVSGKSCYTNRCDTLISKKQDPLFWLNYKEKLLYYPVKILAHVTFIVTATNNCSFFYCIEIFGNLGITFADVCSLTCETLKRKRLGKRKRKWTPKYVFYSSCFHSLAGNKFLLLGYQLWVTLY